MQEKILSLVLEHEDLSWKDLLVDLVAAEDMDPWDIDISLIAQKFIEVLKEMQEADLRISGKMCLAAAILLKVKSHHLLEHDISALDQLLNETEEEMYDEQWDEESDITGTKRDRRKYKLIPRNPQARRRKVSIHDLVNALQKAMRSTKRKLKRIEPVQFTLPDKGVDIGEITQELLNKIEYYTKTKPKVNKQGELSFSQLLPPRAGKTEKVYTFIPLLQLDNQKHVDTRQEEPFKEIYVKQLKK